MRRFKWIEWNLDKIAAHGLSADEAGRRITIIWRYDRDSDEIPNIFGELADPAIFVITAY